MTALLNNSKRKGKKVENKKVSAVKVPSFVLFFALVLADAANESEEWIEKNPVRAIHMAFVAAIIVVIGMCLLALFH